MVDKRVFTVEREPIEITRRPLFVATDEWAFYDAGDTHRQFVAGIPHYFIDGVEVSPESWRDELKKAGHDI